MPSRSIPAAEILVRARNSVYLAFAAAGVALSTWASRLPDIKASLGLTPGQLGTVLLAMAAGSVLGLPSAGAIIKRVGTMTAVRMGTIGAALGIVIAGAGVDIFHSVTVVMGGLFVLGISVGTWDVSMNHQGAAVERHLGRTIMPWFHAAFSAATVVSALLGSLLTALRISVFSHTVGSAVAILAAGIVGVSGFLPDEPEPERDPRLHPAPTRNAWLEPRTLLIGCVVLVTAFTEGTANDWVAVAMVEGHHLPAWAGVLGFATFLGFMTIGRLAGAKVLDVYGRVPVLRGLFLMAVVGSLLVVFGTSWMAFVGAAVWGIGASLGFPVGMSAASDDPARAASRLSVVATIGYLAFLGGPPLLGYLGDHVGVLHALLAVGALAVPALLAVPAMREQRR